MTAPVKRFLIVQVGCLECSFIGDSDPELLTTFESWGEATDYLRAYNKTTDSDAFLVDTLYGSLLSYNSLTASDRAADPA